MPGGAFVLLNIYKKSSRFLPVRRCNQLYMCQNVYPGFQNSLKKMICKIGGMESGLPSIKSRLPSSTKINPVPYNHVTKVKY